MTHRRNLLTAAATLAAALVASTAAAPALAAPSNANTFVLDLSCTDGNTYAVTVVGKAAQPAAAHVLGANSVLIPTAFQFRVTVFDAGGNVIDEATPPLEVVRGRSGTHRDTMSCTFTQTETENLPGVGLVTVRLDGTVHAYTPH